MNTPRLLVSALFVLTAFGWNSSWGATNDSPRGIESYDQAVEQGLPGKVLEKVIARGGRSKKYSDFLPLDGGTVGIAHFAVGGLASLYEKMDTQKYFGRSRTEMARSYSTRCRPPNRRGNDNGWGCYSKKWWRDGMERFLASPESKSVQDAAWGSMMRPIVNNAIQHGWHREREIAIALGVANSLGGRGFEKLAARHDWDAEKTLAAYVSNKNSQHRKSRAAAINEHFPRL